MTPQDIIHNFDIKQFKYKVELSINILFVYEENSTALREMLRITDVIIANLGLTTINSQQISYQLNMLNDFALISSAGMPLLQNQLATEYLAGHLREIEEYENLQTTNCFWTIISFLGSIAEGLVAGGNSAIYSENDLILRTHPNLDLDPDPLS